MALPILNFEEILMIKKNLIYLLLITLLTTIGINAQSQDPPSEDDLKRKIIKREVKDVAEGKWEYDVAYPELHLKGDTPHKAFNAVAKKIAMDEIKAFRGYTSEVTEEEWKKMIAGGWTMSFSYEVEHLDDDIISVRFGEYQYTGGAHGNNFTKTLNYDLKNNKEIKLTDLFKENSNYLNVISKESIQQITKKQGEYAAVDWIKEGASPNLKNFNKWTITKQGLKFYFDPYEVGPYAAGGFETLLPYEKFTYQTQGSKFYDVAKVSYIDGSPPNICRNGLYTRQKVDFALARINGKKNSRAYFYKDENDCPNGINCRGKAYLIPGDEVIYSRSYSDYACVWYQPQKGSETVGWIKKDRLNFVKDTKSLAWIGEWEYAENSITFIPTKTSGRYKVKGDALWKGLGDNVHIGELDFTATAKGGILEGGDGKDKYDCQVKMQRIGNFLLVSDNKMCGGVNVSFDGVYLKKR